jgi:flagellar biosynthesis protein FlhG
MQERAEWLTSFKSKPNALLASNSTSKVKTISITGGKGGVGKTSVAIKVAQTLVKSGSKVLLIDCDYNLSNTSIKLGLPLNRSFMQLLSSELDFEECIYKDGNFHMLSACNGDLDLFDSDHQLEHFIIDIMREHQHQYDYVILDSPAGLTRGILTLNAYCDYRFVVVTPDRSSLTDSYSLIKILNHKYGVKENHLVVNMIKSDRQYRRVVETMCETVENFLAGRTHILGGIDYLPGDSFDKELFKAEKNAIDNSFAKLVDCFVDKLSKGAAFSCSVQDVQ